VLAGTSTALRLSLLDLSGQLVLGSSPIEDESWRGQVRGLALYGPVALPNATVEQCAAWFSD
jgi:hypothetical protein